SSRIGRARAATSPSSGGTACRRRETSRAPTPPRADAACVPQPLFTLSRRTPRPAGPNGRDRPHNIRAPSANAAGGPAVEATMSLGSISLKTQLLCTIVGSIAATAVTLTAVAYRGQIDSLEREARRSVHAAAQSRSEAIARLVAGQQQ